jgi:hypothetical protein
MGKGSLVFGAAHRINYRRTGEWPWPARVALNCARGGKDLGGRSPFSVGIRASRVVKKHPDLSSRAKYCVSQPAAQHHPVLSIQKLVYWSALVAMRFFSSPLKRRHQ